MESSKDIAVIGIGVRFPQAENPKEFWECLRNGVDCVGSLPEGRRQDVEEYVKAVYHEDEILTIVKQRTWNELIRLTMSFLKYRLKRQL